MMREDAGFDRKDITGHQPSPRKETASEHLYDREVPLTGTPGRALLHDWLDGEVDQIRVSETEGRSKVELWTRINAESEMLRRRTTPVHVQQQIMAALPDAPGTTTEWYRQQVTLSPASALLAGAALLAVGALIITMIR
jgi:hypothetical protein